MDYRLTLEERGSVAAELRRNILEKEDPSRLASIEDESTRAHPSNAPSYAFEFFLDRYRERFRTVWEESVDYLVGYSTGSLERDEETRSPERLTRMSADGFMEFFVKNGRLEWLTDKWQEGIFVDPNVVSSERLKLFLYEMIYELAREFCRQRILDLPNEK